MRPLPAALDHVRDDPRYAVLAADPGRPIVIGAKYRQNPATAYCWVGCETCAPGHGPRCWQRKTEATFTYRVRELLHTDPRYGLGRAYLVTLVRPDVWAMRAFTRGVSHPHLETERAKWHTYTGIVWEADLGAAVE